MSFIHYLFIGDFEHDGEMIRFERPSSDSPYKPVVSRPLDTELLKTLLREVTGTKMNDLRFPADWTMGLDDGFLICDRYAGNRDEVDFVTRLVERTGCEVYDVGAHCTITVQEWAVQMQSSSRRKSAIPYSEEEKQEAVL